MVGGGLLLTVVVTSAVVIPSFWQEICHAQMHFHAVMVAVGRLAALKATKPLQFLAREDDVVVLARLFGSWMDPRSKMKPVDCAIFCSHMNLTSARLW